MPYTNVNAKPSACLIEKAILDFLDAVICRKRYVFIDSLLLLEAVNVRLQ